MRIGSDTTMPQHVAALGQHLVQMRRGHVVEVADVLASTNSRIALWVAAVISDSAARVIEDDDDALGIPHAAAPISRKLLRTRSAFSCDMARSTEAVTIWSGATVSRPDARAKIFSARVMPMGSLLRVAGRTSLEEWPGEEFVFLAAYSLRPRIRCTRRRWRATRAALGASGGRSMERLEEALERAMGHQNGGHRNADPGHAQASKLGIGTSSVLTPLTASIRFTRAAFDLAQGALDIARVRMPSMKAISAPLAR